MFGYDNLFWSVTFPCVCAVISWFSITLALLGRARNGYYRRNRYTQSGNESAINNEIVNLGKADNANQIHAWERLLKAKLIEIKEQMEDNLKQGESFTFPVSASEYELKLLGSDYSWDEMIDSLLYWRKSRKLVIRQAVVVVGGDFARSPRMQYHASSLAKSGLFDEILLVGLDCGNKLSETLLKSGVADKLQLIATVVAKDNASSLFNQSHNSATPKTLEQHYPFMIEIGEDSSGSANSSSSKVTFQLTFTQASINAVNLQLPHSSVSKKMERFGKCEAGENTHYEFTSENNNINDNNNSNSSNSSKYKTTNKTSPLTMGCTISTKYLIPPPQIPRWLAFAFPLKVMYWVARTVYKVVSYVLIFTVLLLRACTFRVNYYGQVKITTVVIMQTPPAHPFIPLMKFAIRPLSFCYNLLVYMCFILPASWIDAEAMHELREQLTPFMTHSDSTSSTSAATLMAQSSNTSNHENTIHVEIDLLAVLCQSHENLLNETTETTHKAKEVVYEDNNDDNNNNDNNNVVNMIKEFKFIDYDKLKCFWPVIAVDWHNFGYSILEAAKRPRWVSNIYKYGEYYCCEGDVNITVSQAMKQELHKQVISHECSSLWPANDKEVVVLYDVAPSSFRRYGFAEMMHKVILPMSICSTNISNNNIDNNSSNSINHDVNKVVSNDSMWGINPPPSWIYQRLDKVEEAQHNGKSHNIMTSSLSSERYEDVVEGDDGLFIIASTSWTDDDDYSIVIAALQRLEVRLLHAQSYKEACSSCNVSMNANMTMEGNTFSTLLDNDVAIVNSSSSNNISGIPNSTRMSPSTPVIALSYSANSREEKSTRAFPLLKKIWLLITGKGPSLERFQTEVHAANFSHNIVISTVYLQSYADYAFLLGAADVGLCLHFSSCGLDLPMKGVDMIGAALPVIALRYHAIGELMGETLSCLTKKFDSTEETLELHGNVEAQRRNVDNNSNEVRELENATNELVSNSRYNNNNNNNIDEQHCKNYNAQSTKAVNGSDVNAQRDKEREKDMEHGPIECERGWLFASAIDLETILAHLIGLDNSAWNVIFDTSHHQTRHYCTSDASKFNSNNNQIHCSESRRSGSHCQACSEPISDNTKRLQMSLQEARRRALRQRQHACTWDENWNAVLLSAIKAVAHTR